MKKLLCTTGLFFMLFAAFLIGQAPKIEAEAYSQPTYYFKHEQVGQGKYRITAKCNHCDSGCDTCNYLEAKQGYYLDVTYVIGDNYLDVDFVSGAVATGLTVICYQNPSYTYYGFYSYPKYEHFNQPGTYTFLVEILGNYYDNLVPHTVEIY